MFRVLLALAFVSVDIASLDMPWQTENYDCGPTAAAIATQIVFSRHAGADVGPLSGRYVSLAAVAIDPSVGLTDPIGAYLACGACAEYGVCSAQLCTPDSPYMTPAMVADAETRVPLFVSWPEIDTLAKCKAVLKDKNSAIVYAKAGHAYVLAQDENGSIVEIDPFQPYWRRVLGLPLRITILSDTELNRVWSRLSTSNPAAGVRMN